MKPNAVLPNLAPPMLVWATLAWKTGEMLLASAQVIGHRTQRIARAGLLPNARDRREFTRMGSEKVDAAQASLQAMSMRMVTINQELAGLAVQQLLQGVGSIALLMATPGLAFSGSHQTRLWREATTNSLDTLSHLSGAFAHLAHHGLRPIHSRATSNARRLGRI